MNRSRDMTIQQRAVVDQLKADGFAVEREENSVVVLVRGNDHRLVQMNGTQKRALGARR